MPEREGWSQVEKKNPQHSCASCARGKVRASGTVKSDRLDFFYPNPSEVKYYKDRNLNV